MKQTIVFESPDITLFLRDYCAVEGESPSVAFELIPEQESAIEIRLNRCRKASTLSAIQMESVRK